MSISKTLRVLFINNQFRQTCRVFNREFRVLSANDKVVNKCYRITANQSAIQWRNQSNQKKKDEPAMHLKYADSETRDFTYTDRFKLLVKNYGFTALAVHITVSLTSLGIWYSLVSYGVDISSFVNLDYFGAMASKVAAGSGTFAIAYACHKLIVVPRIITTCVLTPVIVRWLSKVGIMKKPFKHL